MSFIGHGESEELLCGIDSSLAFLQQDFKILQSEIGPFFFSAFSASKGPLDPLILSKFVLEQNLEKMKWDLENANKETDPEIKKMLMFKLHDNAESFGQHLIRFNNTLCQQDFFHSKQQLDVRPYYQIQNFLTEHCLGKYECLIHELQQTENHHLKLSFAQICHSVKESTQCQNDILESGPSIEQMKNIMNQYKKNKIDIFYSLSPLGPKFICSEDISFDRKIKIMNIPLYSSEIILSDALLKKVEFFWNSYFGLKIILKNDSSKNLDSINIKLTENGISYVQIDDPKTIYISKNLLKRKGMLEMTLAHELGHSLGLPDCYVEFLDNNLTSVYYHLDPFDLMCSLGSNSKITERSLEKVFESRCL